MARLEIDAFPAMRRSGRPTELLGRACDAGGVPWHAVDEAFREETSERELYFPLDMHFNAAGHEAFAQLIAPFVKEQLGVQ